MTLIEVEPTPDDARRAVAYLLAEWRGDTEGQVAMLADVADAGRLSEFIVQLGHTARLLARDDAETTMTDWLARLAAGEWT